MRNAELERKSFLLLLAIVSVAFLWILFPLFGAVMWAVALAILFVPLHQRLERQFGGRATWAALATTALVLVLVILPTVMLLGFIVQEGSGVVQRLRSGELDIAAYYSRVVGSLPEWAGNALSRLGLTNLAALQEKLRASAAQGSQQISSQLFAFGQNTLDLTVSFFVMLYLMFFLLRDGPALMAKIRRAAPLNPEQQTRLFDKFSDVVRATVKGNVAVAALQGFLGGLAFMVLGIPGAALWAVVMGFLSLLPAIGAALVWAPVALFLLANGQVWQGVALIVWGTVVIGLVDNVVRPILVGKDTKMPDYVVLVSTIGGMSLFGINGFVIGPVVAAMFIAAWELSAADRDTGTVQTHPEERS